MPSLRVVIQDHTRSKKTLVELPDDVPMDRLLPALAARMQLPLSQAGNPIVYHLDHRTSGRRLGEEDTLGAAGVGADDVLTLLPEVTAAALPAAGWSEVRERRLHSDHRRLQELVGSSDLIHLESAEGELPERYVVRFTCRGVVAAGPTGPQLAEEHRVLLELPAEYPTCPPNIRWLTPIFHPNIERTGVRVCIDVWYPSKFLDELCIMLGRMIQYKNFNCFSALHTEAAVWANQHLHKLPVDSRPLRRGRPAGDAGESFEIRLL